MKKSKIFILAAILTFAAGLSVCGNKYELSTPDNGKDKTGNDKTEEPDYDLVDFPAASDPFMVGEKLAERFIEVRHSYWGNINSDYTANHITYPDVCAWLGAFWFAEETGNDELWNRLADKFDLLFTTEKSLQPNLNTTADNKVDYYVFGAVPLLIYQKRKDARYLELGLKYADGQYTLPSNASAAAKEWHGKGYSWQTRLWIDDMFMITALQAQAYLATGDEKYIKRAAEGMVLYLESLQRPNGLFYHSPGAQFYWARGNGWMAAGMPEVMRILPKTAAYDTLRKKILAGYERMMEGLSGNQADDGMWAQLIDRASASDMWKESSGSAMFTYAMIQGVKNGWLDDDKYGAAARKAWLALQTYLTGDYDMREVCEGTGTGTSYAYYRDRRRWVGDMHGQAGMLWCAFALTGIANESYNNR